MAKDRFWAGFAVALCFVALFCFWAWLGGSLTFAWRH
jgi:ABC-type transporter Mla maintaining outer membrane lipid asymmetry permease subunit MlaE